MLKQSAQNFQVGLTQWVKNLAGLITAAGIVLTVLWYFTEPRLIDWLEDREAPILKRLDKIEETLSSIQGQLVRDDFRIVDFRGQGIVPNAGPYKAGDILQVFYDLRQNADCPTTVQANFINSKTGQVATFLTYEFPATRIPVSRDHQFFVVSVKLPPDTPDGKWSYAPTLTPIQDCRASGVRAPLSEFFIVKN